MKYVVRIFMALFGCYVLVFGAYLAFFNKSVGDGQATCAVASRRSPQRS